MKRGKLSLIEDHFKSLIDNQCNTGTRITNEFCIYWELYDALNQTNHLEQVNFLYFKKEKSLTEISYSVHIEDRTLYGYRKKYMELFEYLAKKYHYTTKVVK